jgi:hypothetical protein
VTNVTSQHDGQPFSIANDRISLSFASAPDRGLTSVRDIGLGVDLVGTDAKPLYRLTLAKAGAEPLHLSSSDAAVVNVKRTSSPAGEGVEIRFEGHAGLDLTVTCRVILEAGEPVSRWRLSIENGTDYGVRAIEYPTVVTDSRDPEECEDEVFAWGFLGGQLTRNPRQNLGPMRGPIFSGLQYPGVISVQFQALYQATGGLYLATHDASGSIKQFGASSVDHRALEMSIEHNHDETPGLSFELPYDTVLATFAGDWYDAADIYKTWARNQHWCSRKTADRPELPAWLVEPRPWLCIISRGDYERLRGTLWSPPTEWPIGKYWPAHKVIPQIKSYSTLFDTPVVTWMEGWEKIGAPGGPVDIFPPSEGADSFRTTMHRLSADGSIPFAYLAGFHWCYKRPMTGYDGWERFEKEGLALAALNPQGNLDHHEFVNNQKYFVHLCVASDATKQLYLDNLTELMDLGIIALQIDQQLGMYTPVCYSSEHGHPVGFGSWMSASMLGFIEEARRMAKERSPQAIFGFEGPCEYWIQQVDVQMHRPYRIRAFGSRGIPLFDYLYHEYALTYGGDDYLGLAHPEAELIKHALVAIDGVQNLIGIGHAEWDYEVDPDYATLTMMRSITAAQRGFARDYLVHGEMLRPTHLECEVNPIELYKHAQFADRPVNLGTEPVPSVFHSVWKTQQGRVGYVLANWTAAPQSVTLELARPASELDFVDDGKRTRIVADGNRSDVVKVRVEPRSMVLLEEV